MNFIKLNAKTNLLIYFLFTTMVFYGHSATATNAINDIGKSDHFPSDKFYSDNSTNHKVSNRSSTPACYNLVNDSENAPPCTADGNNLAPCSTVSFTPGMSFIGTPNFSGAVDLNLNQDFQVHPTDADGKWVSFTLNHNDTPTEIYVYQNVSFEFYNRNGCCQDRIDGSTVTFENTENPTITPTVLTLDSANSVGNIITVTPPQDNFFNKVTITFSGDMQNFREVKIYGDNPLIITDNVAGAGGAANVIDTNDANYIDIDNNRMSRIHQAFIGNMPSSDATTNFPFDNTDWTPDAVLLANENVADEGSELVNGKSGVLTNYALKQENSPFKTHLNTGEGTDLSFKVGNVEKMKLSPDGDLDVIGEVVAESFKLSDGTVLDGSSTVDIGNAYVGNIFNAARAGLKYNTLPDSEFALIQNATGETFLNAGVGRYIDFGIGDTQKMVLSDNLFNINVPVNIFGNTNINGTLTVNGNTIDGSGTIDLGNAYVGEIYNTNYAGFRHNSITNNDSYAILQSSVGATYVNSATGRPIIFRSNNRGTPLDTGGFSNYIMSIDDNLITSSARMTFNFTNLASNNRTLSITTPGGQSGLVFDGAMNEGTLHPGRFNMYNTLIGSSRKFIMGYNNEGYRGLIIYPDKVELGTNMDVNKTTDLIVNGNTDIKGTLTVNGTIIDGSNSGTTNLGNAYVGNDPNNAAYIGVKHNGINNSGNQTIFALKQSYTGATILASNDENGIDFNVSTAGDITRMNLGYDLLDVDVPVDINGNTNITGTLTVNGTIIDGSGSGTGDLGDAFVGTHPSITGLAIFGHKDYIYGNIPDYPAVAQSISGLTQISSGNYEDVIIQAGESLNARFQNTKTIFEKDVEIGNSLLNRENNLTVNGNLTVTGILTAALTTGIFGNAEIGSSTGSSDVSQFAVFKHKDQSSLQNAVALLQNANGGTILNSGNPAWGLSLRVLGNERISVKENTTLIRNTGVFENGLNVANGDINVLDGNIDLTNTDDLSKGYVDAKDLRINGQSIMDIINPLGEESESISGSAFMGNYPESETVAAFGHINFKDVVGQIAFSQTSDGFTDIASAPLKEILIRPGGITTTEFFPTYTSFNNDVDINGTLSVNLFEIQDLSVLGAINADEILQNGNPIAIWNKDLDSNDISYNSGKVKIGGLEIDNLTPAVTDDNPSTLNPATMYSLEGISLKAGGSILQPNISIEPLETVFKKSVSISPQFSNADDGSALNVEGKVIINGNIMGGDTTIQDSIGNPINHDSVKNSKFHNTSYFNINGAFGVEGAASFLGETNFLGTISAEGDGVLLGTYIIGNPLTSEGDSAFGTHLIGDVNIGGNLSSNFPSVSVVNDLFGGLDFANTKLTVHSEAKFNGSFLVEPRSHIFTGYSGEALGVKVAPEFREVNIGSHKGSTRLNTHGNFYVRKWTTISEFETETISDLENSSWVFKVDMTGKENGLGHIFDRNKTPTVYVGHEKEYLKHSGHANFQVTGQSDLKHNVNIGTESEEKYELNVFSKVVNIGKEGTTRSDTLNVYHHAVFNNKLVADKIAVAANPATFDTWPDYVFETNYNLLSLSEVEAFIKKNKHLPAVPSTKEVAEKGLDLFNINATLLEKIEELTLYTIDQEKQIKKLEERLLAQEERLKKLETILQAKK
ncbi:hypothetical protein KORDIASMS9_02913 [Kordia sp. SMS9]|uniref:beta strand repeat-containing protein n=1 Tax=Kordia sp. SMS9 TaxID=2282170 RepID=UPI000E10D7C1|nr:hypothetical protein [Kordia sp. SMS9]AXG70669.1 hypothetical protein KORDIASMS9_02913 [Kordia sp. SMS9]